MGVRARSSEREHIDPHLTCLPSLVAAAGTPGPAFRPQTPTLLSKSSPQALLLQLDGLLHEAQILFLGDMESALEAKYPGRAAIDILGDKPSPLFQETQLLRDHGVTVHLRAKSVCIDPGVLLLDLLRRQATSGLVKTAAASLLWLTQVTRGAAASYLKHYAWGLVRARLLPLEWTASTVRKEKVCVGVCSWVCRVRA